jgi:hypothetical protein
MTAPGYPGSQCTAGPRVASASGVTLPPTGTILEAKSVSFPGAKPLRRPAGMP